MANQAKGEVTARNGDESVKLVLDYNAICELEDLFGDKSIGEILHQMQMDVETGRSKAKDMRAVLWASMLHHQPNASLVDAGTLAQRLGNGLGDKVAEVIKRSEFFEEEKDAPAGKAAAAGKSKAKPR